MSKNKLIVLTGLPFSGKTTLTREIIKHAGGIKVSEDAIKDSHGLDPEHMNQSDWDNLITETVDTAYQLLDDGETVIIDGTNLKKEDRDKARDKAAKLGVQCLLVYLDISEEEIEQRRQHNHITQERAHVSDEIMETASGMIEEPMAEENPILYNGTRDVKTWYENHIEQYIPVKLPLA